MSLPCTRCDGFAFLNLEQIQAEQVRESGDCDLIIKWIKKNENHDVQVCDCCGDGEGWYGIPGEHYNNEDPSGRDGPYAYNGGLCECH